MAAAELQTVCHFNERERERMSTNTKISVSELSKHDKVDDLWVAINGKVYDFTSFAPEHPGTFLFYFAFELR